MTIGLAAGLQGRELLSEHRRVGETRVQRDAAVRSARARYRSLRRVHGGKTVQLRLHPGRENHTWHTGDRTMAELKRLFTLGQTVSTPAALALLEHVMKGLLCHHLCNHVSLSRYERKMDSPSGLRCGCLLVRSLC